MIADADRAEPTEEEQNFPETLHLISCRAPSYRFRPISSPPVSTIKGSLSFPPVYCRAPAAQLSCLHSMRDANTCFKALISLTADAPLPVSLSFPCPTSEAQLLFRPRRELPPLIGRPRPQGNGRRERSKELPVNEKVKPRGRN